MHHAFRVNTSPHTKFVIINKLSSTFIIPQLYTFIFQFQQQQCSFFLSLIHTLPLTYSISFSFNLQIIHHPYGVGGNRYLQFLQFWGRMAKISLSSPLLIHISSQNGRQEAKEERERENRGRRVNSTSRELRKEERKKE